MLITYRKLLTLNSAKTFLAYFWIFFYVFSRNYAIQSWTNWDTTLFWELKTYVEKERSHQFYPQDSRLNFKPWLFSMRKFYYKIK